MLVDILGIVIILLARCGHCPWDITCLYLIAHGEHGPTGGINCHTLITCHHATREVARSHLRELVGLVEHAGLVEIMSGVSAPRENVGGAPPTILGGAKFMQGVFTAIEQVVRNTVQTMQVQVRTIESRATTAMKAFLQLRPPMFKGEPDSLVAEDLA
ncbi:hypothetical protein Acr_11g0011810 [Actinidia rufa]|uniref:Uncharacterized protein n=1 Tax=Actinidia rufa TaxID=165716 RepID=A0A7J0FDW1_9ERIC|nr:hypothetical protein Acr_11g0011810 [Actinidia rufa]